MYRKKDRKTIHFPEFKELLPFGGVLNEDNRLLKLGALIPWDELEDEYAKFFSENKGRPAKDARLIIGAMCIRHKEKLSDEAAAEHIQENPYMQAFCGLDSFNTMRIPAKVATHSGASRPPVPSKTNRSFRMKVATGISLNFPTASF